MGLYVHGSAVQGGLRPSSDLDLLALITRPSTPEERRSIISRLLEISGRRASRGPARPVELTVVRADQVKPWRYPPTVELLYGEWLRDELEGGRTPEPLEMPDLGPEIAIVRSRGLALAGPAPAEVFGRVPADDLRRSVVAGIGSLLEDLESDTRNVLLTLARVWYTVETGRVATKDRAAAWALKQLPAEHRAMLIRAREAYVEGRDEPDWARARRAVRGTASHLVERALEAMAARATNPPAKVPANHPTDQ